MMRKILAFVLPIALAGCASGPQKSATAAKEAGSATKAERPDVKVGDQWKFRCVDYFGMKSERLWVVTSVDQTGIKAKDNGQPLMLTLDLNELESPRGKHSDLRRLSFPLEVGKQWNFEDKYEEQESIIGSEGSGKGSVVVDGYEKVRVGAGEFDAFKLKYESDFTSSNRGISITSSMKSTYWYAPTARAIVKIETFVNAEEQSCELAEFHLWH